MNNSGQRMQIIALASMLIFLAGCGGYYLAEKLYWKANQAAKEISENPAAATSEDYQKLIDAYRRVVDRCPQDPLAGRAQFIIGQIYASQEKFSRAREEFVKVTQNFYKMSDLASRAQFMIGSLYEHEGDWDRALPEYRKVIDYYPLTSMGLRAPIYIAEHYQRSDEIVKADKVYKRAVKGYQKLIDDLSGTSLAPRVKDFLALTYANQGRWSEAIEVWQTIVDEYPDSPGAMATLFTMGEVYQRQIKDLHKAIDVYEGFVERYPQSKIIKYAKFQIGRLHFIKEDFAQARQVFEEIMENYPEDVEFCASAQLIIASSLEKEEDWDKAMRQYRKLTDNYPGTRAALQAPLRIAQYYLKRGQSLKAEEAFGEAIFEYNKIIEENPGTSLAVEAQELISLSYLSRKMWDETIDSLHAFIDTYPDNPKVSASLFTMASIYQKELKKPEKAIEVYQTFIKKYPGHILASLATEQLQALQTQTITKPR